MIFFFFFSLPHFAPNDCLLSFKKLNLKLCSQHSGSWFEHCKSVLGALCTIKEKTKRFLQSKHNATVARKNSPAGRNLTQTRSLQGSHLPPLVGATRRHTQNNLTFQNKDFKLTLKPLFIYTGGILQLQPQLPWDRLMELWLPICTTQPLHHTHTIEHSLTCVQGNVDRMSCPRTQRQTLG